MKLAQLYEEFRPRQLIPNLAASLLIGSTEIFFLASLATLIFSGRLSAFIAEGIGLLLFGGVVLGLAVSIFGSLPGAIPVIQDSPAAIFALAAAAIAAQAQGASSQLYITVVAAISITTVLTGLIFIAIGRFGWSSFVRVVPYPVVGGFLAGTGWLLAQGAMGVLTGLPMHISDVPQLVDPDTLIRWVPGAVLALAILLVLRRWENPFLMPGLLIGGMILFYVVLWASHTPVQEAAARGLLLGPFPSEMLWKPLKLSDLSQVDWSLLASQVGKSVTILMVSSMALLLNASALEIATRKDIDLNRELFAAGIGNILGGLGGSPVGYQAVSTTMLAYQMSSGIRVTTLLVAAMTGAALLFGASLLSFVPKAVVGGLLLYLGLSFLVEWVYDAWRRLPRTEYLLVLSILVIVGTLGFLQGVAAGIIIAVILFAVNYSRIDFVKDTLDGRSYHSNVERPSEHNQLLQEEGSQIHILRLQGYLFFGTTQSLLNRIRARLQNTSRPSLRFLILDFHRVAAVDSSAVLGFARLHQLTDANQVHMILVGAKPSILARLAQGGLAEGQDAHFHLFSNLDYGMEWCENRILSEDSRSAILRAASLRGQLQKVFADAEMIECFMNYLERMELEKGHMLMTQGDAPEAMYFVDSGQVTAELQVEHNQGVRLRSVGAGTVVGEMGLYLKQIRTASVFTTRPTVVYKLSEASLRAMEQNDPEVAAHLHQWMVRLLAKRLSNNNLTLEALLN